MKRALILSVAILVLAGCSGKPSESEIKKLMMSNSDTELMDFNNFKLTNGFQKNDNTYIADVQYDVAFKMDKDEFEENCSRKPEGDHVSCGVALLGLVMKYGDFKKGSVYPEQAKVTLIHKDKGWDIEEIK